jgi:hypothetical protein
MKEKLAQLHCQDIAELKM